MNKKTALQLVLLLIITLILLIYFFIYFNEPPPKIKVSKVEDKKINFETDKSNKIKNIEYIATDNQWNKYIIKATDGYVDNDKSSIIIMRDVRARLIFTDAETIYINSETAIYDSQEYNTKFAENIIIVYGQHKITCEKMDLLFKKNIALFNENVIYNNINTTFFADKMSIDLTTKNSKASMYNSNEKIKIIYKN